MKISAIFTLLLLTTLAGCVFSSETTCPSLEDIFPCICALYRGNVTVACPVLRIPYKIQTLRRILNNLLGKIDVSLTVSNFELNKMPSDLFEGVKIQTLKFEDCYIEALGDIGKPAFSGLEDSLEILSFSNSLDNNLATSLQHLRRLRSVEFEFNTPNVFNSEWLERGPTTVEVLHLHGNGLYGFEDRAVSNLVNLKEFVLSRTKVALIERILLPDIAHTLEILDLSENRLSYLPQDMFSNMPSLKSVDVYRNSIMRLDQATWEPIWEKLEFFNILRNPLQCDSTIDWIFDLRKPKSVNGKCDDPSENKDLQLNQLYKKKENARL